MQNVSLKKNIIYQFIYRILAVLTPLITSPYLSRVLGAEKLGVFSATYAYANYFMLFAMLGVECYGNRAIALCADDSESLKRKFWSIYYVQLMASIVSVIVYYLTIFIFERDRLQVALLQGLWIVSALFDINWFFFGRQQFKLTVTRNIFIKIFTICCIFIFVKTENDLPGYIFIMSFGAIASQLIMWFFLLKEVGFSSVRWEEIKIHIMPIIRLFIPVLALSVFHIMDKTMVDILSDETNGGYYYNVDRLVNIPLGLITSISTVMLPRISKLMRNESIHKAKKLLGKSVELTMFLTCAIAFGLGAISYEFVPFFFGKNFEPCIMLVLAFVPIIIIKALSDFIRQQYLIPSEKDELYIIAVCCGAVVNLLANYILISYFDALGAVIGTFIAESAVLLVQMIGTRKEIKFETFFAEQLYYVFFGIIMFIAVRIVATVCQYGGIFEIVILILFGAGVYMLCSVGYWKTNKNSMFYAYINNITEKMIRRN